MGIVLNKNYCWKAYYSCKKWWIEGAEYTTFQQALKNVGKNPTITKLMDTDILSIEGPLFTIYIQQGDA